MTINLPKLETIIGYSLRRAQIVVFQDFHERFARIQLRPVEFSILVLLAQQPGIRQADLSAALGVRPANMVALVNGLRERQLVCREPDPADRRAQALKLTPAGADLLKKAEAIWREHEGRLVERLGGQAKAGELVAMLSKLARPV